VTEGPSPSQTTLFLTLGASQLAVALAVRASRRRLTDDPWLFLAVLGAAALLAAAIVVTPFARCSACQCLASLASWPASPGRLLHTWSCS
jgi:hypothetical protein